MTPRADLATSRAAQEPWTLLRLDQHGAGQAAAATAAAATTAAATTTANAASTAAAGTEDGGITTGTEHLRGLDAAFPGYPPSAFEAAVLYDGMRPHL